MKQMAYLKIGIDIKGFVLMTRVAKVWGNQVAIHNYMSLEAYNRNYTKLMSHIQNSRMDPFENDREMTLFERTALDMYMKHL